MLFLSFALHYTVNALFFTESNIHQIYEDEGKFNFGYQIDYIIYSMIISEVVMRLMLQFLVLTDKDILQVKLQLTKNMAINMKKEKLKYIKIKFIIFFVLNFILLVLFWYYLACFCAVYKNTQTQLIKNTLISFNLSFLYYFGVYLLPGIFRIISLKNRNKNNECMYNISIILQLL